MLGQRAMFLMKLGSCAARSGSEFHDARRTQVWKTSGLLFPLNCDQ